MKKIITDEYELTIDHYFSKQNQKCYVLKFTNIDKTGPFQINVDYKTVYRSPNFLQRQMQVTIYNISKQKWESRALSVKSIREAKVYVMKCIVLNKIA